MLTLTISCASTLRALLLCPLVIGLPCLATFPVALIIRLVLIRSFELKMLLTLCRLPFVIDSAMTLLSCLISSLMKIIVTKRSSLVLSSRIKLCLAMSCLAIS